MTYKWGVIVLIYREGNWSSAKYGTSQGHIPVDDRAEVQISICLTLKPVLIILPQPLWEELMKVTKDWSERKEEKYRKY